MADFPRFQYDVLVVGAGGAGLRAAIEAAAAGAKVGVVSKSLLGKAHTVMAEGGVAASMANVDDRDNWRVHFSDTMRGGQYLNHPRMAEIHAKEAPDRVRELEAWGALFDRTPDGRILQRNFGGHRYPRLAHVGDRTGLEMIRTLQDHSIHLGIDFHMEHTLTALLKDGDRLAGAFGYDRERGRCRGLRGGGGDPGDRRHRPLLLDHQQQLGVHRRRPRPGLRRRRRPDRHGVRAVPPHRHGLAAQRARASWSPRGCAARAACCATARGGASCSTTSRRSTRSRPPTTRRRGGATARGTRTPAARPELLTRDHVARCIVREVKAGRGTPHGGVFLDISWIKEKIANAAGAHQEEAPQHVPPVQAAGGHRHHQGADGGRARPPTT